jgi:hypothetical protein
MAQCEMRFMDFGPAEISRNNNLIKEMHGRHPSKYHLKQTSQLKEVNPTFLR